ncbi:helix-turn-helix domain-containing protein [Luteipulveratus halotolerans]|uniref:HTH cro/C1-type domain-containing protein n=1 Tax=Luteipulveratus halotolerans TaxID=1631356 RepID=A0A0L6CM24_9MICO|nr:helix-turn-helix transcriptional regulator [Luteipulveratus halotolerans]KNX38851.1 hypothetical protein VV01_19680 [Luteipulveratus halotolerans]
MSATTATTSGARIISARQRVGLSQRQLATASALSQATLSRIEAGDRLAKVPELVALADALGCPVSTLSEHSDVRDRVVSFARAENGCDMTQLHHELVHMLELDAFLDEYGIE